MTVSSTENRVTHTGNGVTTQFAVPYLFLEPGDLVVLVDGTEQIRDMDYTVSGAGTPEGGQVEFLAAPVSGASIVIYRDPNIIQPLDLVENDRFPSDQAERAWDRLTLIAQRNRELVDRAVRLSEDVTDPPELDLPEPQPGEVLVWDDAGGGNRLTNRSITAVAEEAATEAKGYRDEAQSFAGVAGQHAAAAANSAAAAAASASDAAVSASEAQGFRDTALIHRDDTQSLKDSAEATITQFESGFTGFSEGHGYDFGSITTAATYFNRDFGSITDAE